MTDLVEQVETAMGEHTLQYGPATGQICSCGHIAKPDPELLLTQQEVHRRHTAEEIVARIAPEKRDP